MRGFRPFLLLLFLGAASTATRAQDASPRVRDVIYGRKHGVVLTLDVLRPAKPSGVGVLWMVSGGWSSAHERINPGQAKAFLDRGQTVFAVVHGSQPKYVVPEIVQDIDRATRFARAQARDYGVDPERLGIAGMSSGGHLSLMQGVRGKDGNPQAPDPVDRVSSRVQAVACFFPPTDFLNYGEPGKNALDFDLLRPFYHTFGHRSLEPEEKERALRAISPVYAVTKEMPPTLIIHGDADKLVPIQQAQVLMKRLEELGVEHRLVVREGKAHGWPNILDELSVLAEWFDTHAGKK